MWLDSSRRAMAQEIILWQAQYFCIDLISYSITPDDIRQMFRPRPDRAKDLSPVEVAERWLMLCPSLRTSTTWPEPPAKAEIRRITRSRKRVKAIRLQLSDVSWWMRLLCQKTAQRFNQLDNESGPFNRGRFRSLRLLDEFALLAGLSCIDLSAIELDGSKNLSASAFSAINSQIAAQLCSGDGCSNRHSAMSIAATSMTASTGSLTSVLETGGRCSEPAALSMDAAGSEGPSFTGVSSDHHPTASTDQPGSVAPERRIRHPFLNSANRPGLFACLAEASAASCDPAVDEAKPRIARLLAVLRSIMTNDGARPLAVSVSGVEPEGYLSLLRGTFQFGQDNAKPSPSPMLAALCECFGMIPEMWMNVVQNFGKVFSHLAGLPEQIEVYVQQSNLQSWYITPAVRRLRTRGNVRFE